MAQALLPQTTEFPAISTDIAADKLINVYPLTRRENLLSNLQLVGLPGWTQLANQAGASEVRGTEALPGDSVSYWVIDDKAYTLNTSNTLTEIGTLTASSGYVSIAIGETYVMILDPADDKGYTFTKADPSGTFLPISDAQFTALDTFTQVHHIDGYFVVAANETATGTSTFALSDLDNPTSWVTANQASAEAVPDDLQGMMIANRAWYFFGTVTTEVYTNTGKSGLPVSRQAFRDFGLAATNSVVNMDGVVYFIGRTRNKKAVFCKTQGYNIVPVGNTDLDAALQSIDVSDCEAYTLTVQGQTFIYMNFATADVTYVYCVNTGFFVEAQINAGNRHIMRGLCQFNDKIYIGSRNSGQIFEIDSDIYTENGTNINRTVILPTLFSNNAYIHIGKLTIFIDSSSFSSNQTLTVTASYDGGDNYNTALTDSISQNSDYAVFYQFTGEKRVTLKITYTGALEFIINNINAIYSTEGGV